MKRFLLLFAFAISTVALLAQAPSGFKFQAVARDVDNNAMATENIAVRVSLLRGGPSGAVSYSERHEVTTTDLGVFDLHIGNGVSLSGDMTTIDWGADNYYLKVDIDPDGGTSYINLGASQLLSVPYAMYANAAGSGGGGGDPTDELQNLIYDPTTQTLTLTDGNSVTLQVGGGGGMPQTLAFDESSRTLTISDGNAITIPGGATGPQGEQGPQGETGAPGPRGEQGPQG
ncbi:collagen-like protein, partial [Neolewinella agarilytica]|uniref:collagen-like triple helix repeat-containing protein n=1 Tax=Neolewinella agarilytica TaxID=478744 RepID=UPI00399C8D65